jgi:RNA polymerase sigma-70 factor (ECF subfamily)
MTELGPQIAALRPELHRYCARMTGSVLDGEDLVQEALAVALCGIPDEAALRPWLFKIAHHKCVDFLRARRPMVELDEGEGMSIEPEIEVHERAAIAFGAALELPPRERASVILADVLGHSLEEIAAVLETSVGSVKAALHRGRTKLATLRPVRVALSPESQRYLEAFDRRDWTTIGALLGDDVRLELVGFKQIDGREAVAASYLYNYAKLSYAWRMVPATVDGEPVIVCLADGVPHHAIRLTWRDGRVVHIRDYAHVTYLFREGEIAL